MMGAEKPVSEAAVSSLFNEFWSWRLRESPEFATQCGVHDYDDRLDDNSLQALMQQQEDASLFYAQCKELLRLSNLSDADRRNLSLFADDLNTYIAGFKHKGFVLCVSYMEGIHVDFELLTSWMKFESEADLRKYIARLKALPKRLCDVMELLKHGVEHGITQHARSMEGVLETLAEHNRTARETAFFVPLISLPSDLDEALQVELRETAEKIIMEEIQPAMSTLKNYIRLEYLPACRGTEGVHGWVTGEEFYSACLAFHTSCDLSPRQVHDLGLAEVSRINQQINEVMASLGFQSRSAFITYLRENPKFGYDSKEELMERYKNCCYQVIRQKLSSLFWNIPSSPMDIVPAPESRPDAPVAYYLAGTLDGSRPGRFYVNCHDLKAHRRHEMMTLSLHEGEPGHHFQNMYAIESEGVPEFRKFVEDANYFAAPSRFPLHTAYMEGWGLYCEWLGEEMGLYEDPYERMGTLSFEMHRACRLVVDPGIHAFGWTFDEAVQYLSDNSPISEIFIKTEVKRYVTWPGQACAYKIGQLKIQELRRRCEAELGGEFDVRHFHEIVLACLPASLPTLEARVDEYLVNNKVSAPPPLSPC